MHYVYGRELHSCIVHSEYQIHSLRMTIEANWSKPEGQKKEEMAKRNRILYTLALSAMRSIHVELN